MPQVNYKKWLPLLLITVLLFSLIIIGIDGSTAKDPDTIKLQAEKIAKQMIADYLKSPASAQFPDIYVSDEINGNNQWWLDGWNKNDTRSEFVAFGNVDSQNSFGAMLRSHFFMKFKYSGLDADQAANWKINRLELDHNLIISDGAFENPPFPMNKNMVLITTVYENLYKKLNQLVRSRDTGEITEEKFIQESTGLALETDNAVSAINQK